jgi:short-subunit dehydrogenase
MSKSLGTALVTGASTGIGATYADRLARRGYDLVLVARNADRLQALAERLRQTGVEVRVQVADLTADADVKAVEAILKADASITLLVNNAGIAGTPGFAAPDMAEAAAIIGLNISALVRLTGAAVPAFLARGSGAIVNIASVLAYGAEVMPGVYSATKAFVDNFTQGLQHELGPRGLYVQAVLPAATRTEIWDTLGGADSLPPGTVMAVGDMVDAALVGFDRRELVTWPSLSDDALWAQLEDARRLLMGKVRNEQSAARYRTAESV